MIGFRIWSSPRRKYGILFVHLCIFFLAMALNKILSEHEIYCFFFNDPRLGGVLYNALLLYIFNLVPRAHVSFGQRQDTVQKTRGIVIFCARLSEHMRTQPCPSFPGLIALIELSDDVTFGLLRRTSGNKADTHNNSAAINMPIKGGCSQSVGTIPRLKSFPLYPLKL